jgi:hypothetical protein
VSGIGSQQWRLGLAAILISHKGVILLEPGSWTLTPETPPPAHPFCRVSDDGGQKTEDKSVVRRLFCVLWPRASSSAG